MRRFPAVSSIRFGLYRSSPPGGAAAPDTQWVPGGSVQFTTVGLVHYTPSIGSDLHLESTGTHKRTYAYFVTPVAVIHDSGPRGEYRCVNATQQNPVNSVCPEGGFQMLVRGRRTRWVSPLPHYASFAACRIRGHAAVGRSSGSNWRTTRGMAAGNRCSTVLTTQSAAASLSPRASE